MSWWRPLNCAKSTVCGWESTLTSVEPLLSVTAAIVSWHMTTLGSAASVATVKTDADCGGGGEVVIEEPPPPQPASTSENTKMMSAWAERTLRILFSSGSNVMNGVRSSPFMLCQPDGAEKVAALDIESSTWLEPWSWMRKSG